MQILHFGSGGFEGEGLSTQLAYWKQQLDAAPQCWDCPQTIRDLLFKLSVARETLILPTPDGRAGSP